MIQGINLHDKIEESTDLQLPQRLKRNPVSTIKGALHAGLYYSSTKNERNTKHNRPTEILEA